MVNAILQLWNWDIFFSPHVWIFSTVNSLCEWNSHHICSEYFCPFPCKFCQVHQMDWLQKFVLVLFRLKTLCVSLESWTSKVLTRAQRMRCIHLCCVDAWALTEQDQVYESCASEANLKIFQLKTLCAQSLFCFSFQLLWWGHKQQEDPESPDLCHCFQLQVFLLHMQSHTPKLTVGGVFSLNLGTMLTVNTTRPLMWCLCASRSIKPTFEDDSGEDRPGLRSPSGPLQRSSDQTPGHIGDASAECVKRIGVSDRWRGLKILTLASKIWRRPACVKTPNHTFFLAVPGNVCSVLRDDSGSGRKFRLHPGTGKRDKWLNSGVLRRREGVGVDHKATLKSYKKKSRDKFVQDACWVLRNVLHFTSRFHFNIDDNWVSREQKLACLEPK